MGSGASQISPNKSSRPTCRTTLDNDETSLSINHLKRLNKVKMFESFKINPNDLKYSSGEDSEESPKSVSNSEHTSPVQVTELLLMDHDNNERSFHIRPNNYSRRNSLTSDHSSKDALNKLASMSTTDLSCESTDSNFQNSHYCRICQTYLNADASYEEHIKYSSYHRVVYMNKKFGGAASLNIDRAFSSSSCCTTPNRLSLSSPLNNEPSLNLKTDNLNLAMSYREHGFFQTLDDYELYD